MARFNLICTLATRYAKGHLCDLATSRQHPPYLTRHRVEAVVMRTRLVAAAFTGLTLLWIALDALTLPWPTWGWLAGVRVVAACIFFALAMPRKRTPQLADALGMLALLLAVPLVFYLAAQVLFGEADLSGPALVNARLYEALPFVVLAGLSIFPLAVAEGLMFAVPILALVGIGPVAAGDFDWVNEVSTLWVLVLILGVYLLAGMIQLHYMMALLRRASHDPLTNAFTRRSGMELLDAQFRLAVEQDLPLALAFFDIDNFKSVNDTWGHEEGDRVLKEVAEAIGRLLRRGDAVIRWGGEEFVVVMVSTGLPGVKVALERVLTEWLGQRLDGKPVTASIGVAERIADRTDDWPQLIDLADRRMYQAKTTGKARCIFPEEVA
ncbi:MAG: GGDEF domain-containing protein [Magnetospirillum sp.]|nr:GGDEF domain-containing protein [Magnetospirillum sp.]